MPRYLLGETLGGLASRSQVIERMVWGTEAGIASGLWRFSQALGPVRGSDFGAGLMGRVGPRLRKHKHVLRNLAVALPERSAKERAAIAVEVWRNFGRVLMEFPHFARYSGPERPRWIDYVDEGGVAWLKRQDRAGLFLTPHVGNWNLSVNGPDMGGIRLSVLYSRQSNPRLESRLDVFRRALPCDYIDAALAGRQLMAELRAGRSIGLLPDQRFDAGEMVPFFGHDAPTPLSPVRIALSLKVPVILARVERLEGGRFRVTLQEPLPIPDIADRREQARLVMRAVNTQFEQWIREKPGEWLCAKRRWPKSVEVAP